MAGKTVAILGGGVGGPAMACRKAAGGVSVIQTFVRNVDNPEQAG